MGLSALALEGNPVFPTYPNRMSDADVSAGLVLPYAAVALLGSGGAVATLLIVFMAVTSASSSGMSYHTPLTFHTEKRKFSEIFLPSKMRKHLTVH
jgi:Na+/proline symporter